MYHLPSPLCQPITQLYPTPARETTSPTPLRNNRRISRHDVFSHSAASAANVYFATCRRYQYTLSELRTTGVDRAYLAAPDTACLSVRFASLFFFFASVSYLRNRVPVRHSRLDTRATERPSVIFSVLDSTDSK